MPELGLLPASSSSMGQADVEALNWAIESLVALLFLALMVAACEVGFSLGCRSKTPEKTRALVPIITGSILGLLGLLLGFTMSMSVSRYDARRRLVLEEANAIREAYLRMEALPPPDSIELQDLLRQYADNRLRISQSTLDISKLRQGKEEDARLQTELWSRVVALARKDSHSVSVGLLMESLNAAFDLENSRWVGFVAHLPNGLIYLNAFMGLVVALMVGYEFGTTGHRHPLSELLLIVSISMVMVLIVELDQPYSGAIRVSQQPLIDLQRRLAIPEH